MTIIQRSTAEARLHQIRDERQRHLDSIAELDLEAHDIEERLAADPVTTLDRRQTEAVRAALREEDAS